MTIVENGNAIMYQILHFLAFYFVYRCQCVFWLMSFSMLTKGRRNVSTINFTQFEISLVFASLDWAFRLRPDFIFSCQLCNKHGKYIRIVASSIGMKSFSLDFFFSLSRVDNGKTKETEEKMNSRRSTRDEFEYMKKMLHQSLMLAIKLLCLGIKLSAVFVICRQTLSFISVNYSIATSLATIYF